MSLTSLSTGKSDTIIKRLKIEISQLEYENRCLNTSIESTETKNQSFKNENKILRTENQKLKAENEQLMNQLLMKGKNVFSNFNLHAWFALFI